MYLPASTASSSCRLLFGARSPSGGWVGVGMVVEATGMLGMAPVVEATEMMGVATAVEATEMMGMATAVEATEMMGVATVVEAREVLTVTVGRGVTTCGDDDLTNTAAAAALPV